MVNKYYKIIGANALIAFLAWKFLGYIDYVLNIITLDSFSFNFEALAVANFILLASVISLGLTTFRKKRWALVMAGVVGSVFLLTFGWSYINLVGVGVTALLFLYAQHNGVEEIDQRTKINPRMMVRQGAPAVIVALFILISFAAFQSPVAKGIAQTEQLPSASQQLLRSIVNSVISGQIEAGKQEKENIISEITSRTFRQLNDLLKPYFKYTPPLLAFGLFLILWGLSWVFIWLSVFVGMLTFWILKKVKFVKIEEKDSRAEILVTD